MDLLIENDVEQNTVCTSDESLTVPYLVNISSARHSGFQSSLGFSGIRWKPSWKVDVYVMYNPSLLFLTSLDITNSQPGHHNWCKQEFILM